MKLIPTTLLLLILGCSQPEKPLFRVVDTDFSKGRLGFEQALYLDDLVKFHGHQCDGLVVGAQALQVALAEFYPNQPIDRTNLRIVSKPSPCLTDVAVYVAGGRYQFNTFYVDTAFAGLYIIQRIDNGETISVSLNPGVKPSAIDSLGTIANRGQLSPCQLDSLRAMEDAFMQTLQESNPRDNYTVKHVNGFSWKPYAKIDYKKIDVVNKNLPKCGMK